MASNSGESPRNFVSNMTTEGRFDGGAYKCDISYNNPVNERLLSTQLCLRVQKEAKMLGGEMESRTISYPDPNTIFFSETFAFKNKASMLAFAQGVGYPQDSRAIHFLPDFASFQALP